MAPSLPRPQGRRSFLKQTVAEWESWPWDTWNEAQAAHAARAIVLIDDLNRAKTPRERILIDQSVRQALRALGLTKKDDEDSEEAKEERRRAQAVTDAEASRVSRERLAIRTGVEVIDLHRGWRDRGGCWHDMREVLFMDTWDALLEDERQAQAEADGTWPEKCESVTVKW